MRLVVFADGTWNKMDAGDKGTNVVKLCAATLNDKKVQTTFYDPGVGTRWYNRLRGGAFGVGISENIKECYKFIVEQWHDHEDEIFLFGFSRGAYTVRSLAGLIHFAGIVRDKDVIDQAYDFYRDAKKITPKTEEEKKSFDPKRKAEFDSFRRNNTRDLDRAARIKMIGVWDTVGALGIPQSWLNEHLNPFPHEFHDTSLGDNVDHAVHALSIDEKRKAFQPTLWDPDPRALQVFFSGVHSDVGGGYDDDRKLGDITLRWMAKRAEEQGLQLDWSRLPEITGEDCGEQHESWTAAWRVVRRYDREIAAGSSISGSVRKRLEELDQKKFKPHPYAPVRLAKPWERFEWVEWPEES
jgi:uncharacterized protein (DUF2235 family)